MNYILVIIVYLLLSFGVTALLIKGICWAFGVAFSLKIAFGIWLIFFLAKAIFGRGDRD